MEKAVIAAMMAVIAILLGVAGTLTNHDFSLRLASMLFLMSVSTLIILFFTL